MFNMNKRIMKRIQSQFKPLTKKEERIRQRMASTYGLVQLVRERFPFHDLDHKTWTNLIW